MKILLIFTLLCLSIKASAKAPNILFILADDQSWSGTSVRMKADEPRSGSTVFKTPNLEKLAAQGMVFSQAYAAHCKCECSRAAIQMGRSTTTLNAPDKSSRNWSAPVTHSLVNTLKKADASYKAAHFGKWHVGRVDPSRHGFDDSEDEVANDDNCCKHRHRDVDDEDHDFCICRRLRRG